jgi:phage nucleotide-binding protein
MKIGSTKNIQTQGVKALVYGQSGIGKTTLAGTLLEPTIIISFEGGLLSLKGKDIDIMDCTVDDEGKPLSDAERIMKLSATLNWLAEEEQKTKYRNIFVDSLTDIAETMVKALEIKHAGSSNKFAVWGDLAKNMISIVRTFRNYPGYNIFFTALEDEIQLEGQVFYAPLFPGKVVGPKVMQSFDEVFRMTLDKDGRREFLCQPGVGYKAKDRSGSLLNVEIPDLQVIIDKISKEKE